MAAKIYLPIVEPTDEDSVIGGAMPVLVGDDPEENLACGRCKSVIAKNVSTLDLGKKFSSQSGRLILQCECGAHNAVVVAKI